MISKKILLFNVNIMKENQIRILCNKLGIELVVVEKKDFCQSLGTLAGIMGFKYNNKKVEYDDLKEEMMIFSGIDSDSLDEFLREYKKNMIAPIQLKAIITGTNISWDARKINNELKKEHNIMTQ